MSAFCPSTSRLQSASAVMRRVSVTPLRVLAKESRIGRSPIPVPKGTTVSITGTKVVTKGPLGTLEWDFSPTIKIEQVGDNVICTRIEDSRTGRAQHGLVRTLTSNMVVGVSTGFSKRLELIGTGYRSSVADKVLTLNVGYSKPRLLVIPDNVTVKVEKNTSLTISSASKNAVGDLSATIRAQRPPEPYKGKGVRNFGEVIKLKEGKGAGKKK
jgi:large subunit ribosomal protein L6